MNYLDVARRTLETLVQHSAAVSSIDPPDELREADARSVDDPEAGDDEHIEVIDPPDPCPECGSLELWQTLTGNWRCLRCDPPTTARRLRERAARRKIQSSEHN